MQRRLIKLAQQYLIILMQQNLIRLSQQYSLTLSGHCLNMNNMT
jgi:hypothetical protein